MSVKLSKGVPKVVSKFKTHLDLQMRVAPKKVPTSALEIIVHFIDAAPYHTCLRFR
jgi:hypothetical protein